MKIKRAAKLIAVVLAVAMLPFTLFACGKLSGTVSSRLVEMMVGDGSLSTKDASSATYLETLDAEVNTLKSRFSSGTWSTATITNGDTATTMHYKNLYKMATAWATKKSALYHDGDVLSKIKDGLQYGYENLYGADAIGNRNSKITMSERIDPAEYLVRTLLIMVDGGKISKSKATEYLTCVDVKFPAPFGEGIDLMRIAYVSIASAAIKGDSDKIELVMSAYLPSAVGYATGNAGLHTDGSFLDDYKTASSASYGVSAFSLLTEIAYSVKGTSADFAEDLAIGDFLYKWALDSVISSLHNGTAFASLVGYQIAEADNCGGKAVSALLALSEILDKEKSNDILSYVKAYSEAKSTAFTVGLTSYGACAYAKLVSNSKITAKKMTGATSFADMDRLTILGNKYSVALATSSSRSAKYETGTVNIKSLKETLPAVNGDAWYTGDGMLLIYSDDYQYGARYWKNVNKLRIPGTTTDNRPRTSEDNGKFNGSTDYAGSAVLGNYAVSAYEFINNNSEYRSDLTAKKSYFFFDNEIVCLGAGISNSDVNPLASETAPHTIETVVENVYYGTNVSLPTSASEDDDIALPAGKKTELPEAVYVMKFGGIYVPSASNDAFYATLNTSSGTNFVELTLDHGSTPNGAKYEYAILPAATTKLDAFYQYVAAPEYTVISNTESVQAVKDSSTGITSYVFWEGAEVNGVKTDMACTILVRETDSDITIAISDFTHHGIGNKTGSTITLTGNYTLSSASDGITFSGNVITLDRSVFADGQTRTITLKK